MIMAYEGEHLSPSCCYNRDTRYSDILRQRCLFSGCTVQSQPTKQTRLPVAPADCRDNSPGARQDDLHYTMCAAVKNSLYSCTGNGRFQCISFITTSPFTSEQQHAHGHPWPAAWHQARCPCQGAQYLRLGSHPGRCASPFVQPGHQNQTLTAAASWDSCALLREW